MPRTTRGKVVYKRIRHEFSITDATRIINKLEPQAEELPYIIPYVQATRDFFLRVVFAVLRLARDPAPDLEGTARILATVLEGLFQESDRVSGELTVTLKDIIRLVVGEK